MLDIASYDEAERLQKAALGTQTHVAFSPVTFRIRSFPDHVTGEEELPQFSENMNMLASSTPWLDTIHIARHEADLINRVNVQVLDVNTKVFGTRVAPYGTAIRMLPLLRFITAFANRFYDRPLRILEIGPGAGYLGTMLVEAGHSYVAVDATQGFYLWQNRMWSHLFGDALRETALDDTLERSLTHKITHVPWWHFARMRSGLDWGIDLVISRAVLAETALLFQNFAVRVARDLLGGRGAKAFVFDGVGAETFGNLQGVHGHLIRGGYHNLTAAALNSLDTAGRCHADLHVYAPPNSDLFEHGTKELENKALPAVLEGVTPDTVLPGGAPELFPVGDLVHADRETAYPDYSLFEYMGVPSPYTRRR